MPAGRLSVARSCPLENSRKLNDGRSLRAIAAGLAEQGFVTPSGKEYSATSIKRMLGEGGSKSRALTHHDAKGRRLLWPEKPMTIEKGQGKSPAFRFSG